MRRNRVARRPGVGAPVVMLPGPRPLPFRPAPAPAPGVLTAAQFVGQSNPIDPVVEGVIWSHVVPEGRMVRLGSRIPSRDQVVRARPMVKETGTATTSAGGVLTITLAVIRIMASADLPGVGSIRVAVATGGGNYVKQAAAALTVDYATQVVTVSGLTASTAYDWVLYGLPADPHARFRIAVSAAGAGLTSEQTVFETGLVDLFQVAQFQGEQVPRLSELAIARPKDQILVYVESLYRIVHKETLTPGALVMGDDLETIELRTQQLTAAALADWVSQYAPGVGLDRIWRAIGEIQAGRAPQDPELANVPPIPGFEVA